MRRLLRDLFDRRTFASPPCQLPGLRLRRLLQVRVHLLVEPRNRAPVYELPAPVGRGVPAHGPTAGVLPDTPRESHCPYGGPREGPATPDPDSFGAKGRARGATGGGKGHPGRTQGAPCPTAGALQKDTGCQPPLQGRARIGTRHRTHAQRRPPGPVAHPGATDSACANGCGVQGKSRSGPPGCTTAAERAPGDRNDTAVGRTNRLGRDGIASGSTAGCGRPGTECAHSRTSTASRSHYSPDGVTGEHCHCARKRAGDPCTSGQCCPRCPRHE